MSESFKNKKKRLQWLKALNINFLDEIVCQWLATGRWFSPGTRVSSTNKTDRHDITDEILLKVALNTITLTLLREYRRDNQKRKIQKQTIYGTQDEEKQNKNTKQYVLDTTLRKQTQIYIYHSTKRITYMHRNENNKHMDTKKTPASVNDHN